MVKHTWALLLGAIVAEVAGTLSLRASQDHPGWLGMVVIGYVTAFFLLAQVIRAGMPIAVAYGTWGALGTALTAGIAAVIFGERLTAPIIGGIVLIIGGVLMIEFGSHSRTAEDLPS